MRHITPRSLCKDLSSGKLDCEADLRPPITQLIKRAATVQGKEGKTRWKRQPVLDMINNVIATVEKLLWDSGELTENQTEQRQRIYTQVVDIKRQVEESLTGQHEKTT